MDHHPTCRLTNPQEIKETEEAVIRAPKNLPGVHFVPWIGKRYGKDGLFSDKQLLILGASHYEWCESCWKDSTQRGKGVTCRCVAELVVDGAGRIPHWPKIEYALTGEHLDQADRAAFWHSVAYYNYIQEMVGFFKEGAGRPPKPTPQMWESAESPFREIMKHLSPDIIVVLGYTLWENLPGEDSQLASITENGKELQRCSYRINDRTTIACCVRHPAAGLGKPWYPALRKAIADV